MLKAGIFIDVENIKRSGGFGIRYDVLRNYVTARGATVLRANAYLAKDEEAERLDAELAQRNELQRAALRRNIYRVVTKPVKWYQPATGPAISKANADLDLAVDAMMQARNLDYVVLVSGDGDFAKLATALQSFGCRVDVIGFHNVSRELREAADHFNSGFFIPGLLPIAAPDRYRGHFHAVVESKYFGHITLQTGLAPEEVRDDIFCHGSDLEAGRLLGVEFAKLRGSHNVVEFSLQQTDKGTKAVDVVRVRPA